MKKLVLPTLLLFACVVVNNLKAQIYVDFQQAIYYTATGNNLTSSGLSLVNFNFNTAPNTHPIFNDGLYYAVKDYSGKNLWIRVRHIADDPNGTTVGVNVTKTASSPFRSGGFGGWWGFKYQFDIYKDLNINGLAVNTLDGLSPTNIIVESIETLSAPEWISLQNINSESTAWSLDSRNFTGLNPNSNPGFSATNLTYATPGYTSTFPTDSKMISAIDNGSSPGYAEFRIVAGSVSQFLYGYEYPNSGGYQGIRIYIGNPDIPAAPDNDNCENAVVLTPSVDGTFSGSVGTLTSATTSSSPDCENNQSYDVWYKFVATSEKHRILLTNATIPETMNFQFYSGSCSALNSINCATNFNDSIIYSATDLSIGSTYYLKVFNRSSFASQNNFNIGVTTPEIVLGIGHSNPQNAISTIYVVDKSIYIDLLSPVVGIVNIYNVTGQLVKIAKITKGLNKEVLTTSGIYIIKLLYGNAEVIKKVWIQ